MVDEIRGEGNSVNYKYRMHDPRIGRFFAVDPLAAKYPQWTPYSFSGNKVIHMVELEGLEPAWASDPNGWSPVEAEYGTTGEMRIWYPNGDGGWNSGAAAPVEVTARETTSNGYSSEFNSLNTNTQNFLLNKMNSMSSGKYKDMFHSDIVNGFSNYGRWADSDWWTAGAQKNWEDGFQGWDPNGIGAFWMNATTYGVGGTMLLTTGALLMDGLPAGGGAASLSAGLDIVGSAVVLPPYLSWQGIRYIGGRMIWTNAIGSGTLNLGAQLHANGGQFSQVDPFGVGSAFFVGGLSGNTFAGITIASASGAAVDASFDWTYAGGFKSVFNNSKDMNTFGKDFTFGFMGNFCSGLPGISPNIGTGLGFANEATMDLFFINTNVGVNNW